MASLLVLFFHAMIMYSACICFLYMRTHIYLLPLIGHFKSCVQTATTTAEAELLIIHPIRLGLALNFSVFYYEIMNSPERFVWF